MLIILNLWIIYYALLSRSSPLRIKLGNVLASPNSCLEGRVDAWVNDGVSMFANKPQLIIDWRVQSLKIFIGRAQLVIWVRSKRIFIFFPMSQEIVHDLNGVRYKILDVTYQIVNNLLVRHIFCFTRCLCWHKKE